MAENRVLRQLAGVPENYGFDLEEVKLAEKSKIEDFKSQVRYLEKEVEELEAERTQLRQRLRAATILKGNQTIADAEYNKSMEYQQSKRQLENELTKLKAKLEAYESNFGGGFMDRQEGGMVPGGQAS